ncbi:MAG: hypothetical protein ACLR13_01455 [Acutalibacteraceae bacterium]
MHNLYFYNSFMEKIRTALDSGSFQAFTVKRYIKYPENIILHFMLATV